MRSVSFGFLGACIKLVVLLSTLVQDPALPSIEGTPELGLARKPVGSCP